MSTSYKTPSHFSEFNCLGSDCEDTCCQNWEVKLDRKHFDVLKSAMSKDNIDKSMFEQYIRLNDSSISSDHDYAFIRMGVNGYCAMLDDKGLCSIHSKYGISALGNVCTMFPRVISRCGNSVELSGALSCPEVVRNCIDDNKPLKLQRFKTSELPRSKNYPIQRELLDIDDVYSANFDIVRKKLMQVMANDDLTLEARLYATAHLTYKISDFYHKGCHSFESKQLETALEDLTKKDLLVRLAGFIKEYDANPTLSMIVVHSILSIKLQQANSENTSQLYTKIISKLASQDDNAADVLASKLAEITSTISSENKAYVDKAISRYILNCLYREWFIAMPDPFTYVQMLLVRTSILRALIFLDIADEELELHELKERVVYVMYNFARNIDQNLEFLKVVYNALSEQTMMNFDFSPTFIRLY